MKILREIPINDGTYLFSGTLVVTPKVESLLSKEEIMSIYNRVRNEVKNRNGLDYLQVFKIQQTNQKLFFIDQMNREQLASKQFPSERNYCTLMIAEEY